MIQSLPTTQLVGAPLRCRVLPSPAPRRALLSSARICALLALSFLGACAVGPDYHRPVTATGDGYAPTAMPDSTVSAPGPEGDAQRFVMGRDIPFAWWRSFQSPQLDKLVDQALQANPTIPAAQAALRQALEYVYAQQGYFYPTVGADFNAERQKLDGNNGGNSPGVQGNGATIATGSNPKGPNYNSPVVYNFYTAQLVLGYTPDVFGGNRRAVESLHAQADALRYQMEATYITLASNVVGAAIQVASLRSQIAATREFIDENVKALDIVRRQFAAGYAMRIDVALQESALAQARQLLPPLQKQLEQTHDLVRVLCGKLPNEPVDDDFDLSALQLPPELPLSLPSKLVEQRPDVRAAEEQLHSASAQVGVAIANRLPQFTITGAIGGTASKVNQMFSPGGPFWNLIGDVAQPIFDGGTLLHRERAADEGLRQAAAQYRLTLITAFQNVADTLHAVQSDADALAATVAAEQAAKTVLDVTDRQYRAGYVSFLTLLSAQESYQQTLVTLVQARTNRLGDTAALFQALGGGWWNRPAGDSVAVADTSAAGAAVHGGATPAAPDGPEAR
jgi:NodT family efflux transporter outer membrane factor (OMF) lipoprotein